MEMRSAAQAARVTALNRAGADATEAERQLWLSIDALTVLRVELWALQGAQGAAAPARATDEDRELLSQAVADAEARRAMRDLALGFDAEEDLRLLRNLDEELVALVRARIRLQDLQAES
ncbi:hypothetical protein [Methylobacterium sp. ID0610]|uniref:hypothetical protein n=1 Tax=Methylobacterium carpenticola TaxID=3344827 RepID=UPI0036B4104E